MMFNRFNSIVILLSFGVPDAGFLLAQEKTGIVTGEIRDAATRQSLPAATISLMGTSYGAASDSLGRFGIRIVEPGKCLVRASYVGYETAILSDIGVAQSRNTTVNFDLTSASALSEGMTITG